MLKLLGYQVFIIFNNRSAIFDFFHDERFLIKNKANYIIEISILASYLYLYFSH